ncbi:hypothetical protein BDW68DRAFT_182826 [Aspergillus falconensis]
MHTDVLKWKFSRHSKRHRFDFENQPYDQLLSSVIGALEAVAFHIAIKENHDIIAILLVRRRQAIKCLDNRESSPIMKAGFFHKALIKTHVDLHAELPGGQTAPTPAAAKGHTLAVEYLWDAEADAEAGHSVPHDEK